MVSFLGYVQLQEAITYRYSLLYNYIVHVLRKWYKFQRVSWQRLYTIKSNPLSISQLCAFNENVINYRAPQNFYNRLPSGLPISQYILKMFKKCHDACVQIQAPVDNRTLPHCQIHIYAC